MNVSELFFSFSTIGNLICFVTGYYCQWEREPWSRDKLHRRHNVTLFNIDVFSVRIVLTLVEISSSWQIFIVPLNGYLSKIARIYDLTVLVWPTFHPPWSSRFSSDDAKEVVHYQTISPKSLAKSVLEEGGWSNFMVSITLVKWNLSSHATSFEIINSCIETSSLTDVMIFFS